MKKTSKLLVGVLLTLLALALTVIAVLAVSLHSAAAENNDPFGYLEKYDLDDSGSISIADVTKLLDFLSVGCDHKLTVLPAVPVTCTENGLTEGKYCPTCDRTVTAQTVIYAKGHIFDGDLCTVCGFNKAGGQNLAFTLNSDNTTYTVSGIGNCKDNEIIIPDTVNGKKVTAIGDKAFADCTNIKRITIPDTVKTIGTRAFYGCTALTEMTIPSSVTSIGTQIFYKSGVKTVYYNSTYCASGNQFLNTVDKIVFNGSSVPKYFASYTSFNGTSVEIGENVENIGYQAFKNCSNITSAVINKGVKLIDDEAFYGCAVLTGIAIPNSVTSIGNSAFYNCNKLTSIVIGNNVKSIGYEAFYYCISLTRVDITDLEAWLNMDCKDNPLALGAELYLNGKPITEIVIPDGVSNIGDHAFSGCSSLTSVVIPDSVTSIGDYAFYDCSSLTSVVIPDSVTSIGSYAFAWCSNLTSVVIPDSVNSIGNYAFSYCSRLTSVVIPDSVNSIGSYAFYCCYKLVEVVNNSSLPITAGSEDYSYAGYYAKEVHSGTSKIVNKDGYLFYTYGGTNYLVGYVGNDTALVLPANYNGQNYVINQYAFCYNNNDKITSVVIPDSVTSIGKYAFSDCYKLVEVINHSSLNITAGSSGYGYVGYYAKEVHTGTSKIVNKDGYLFYPASDGTNYLFNYTGNNTALVLPANYNGQNYEIYRYAFYKNNRITSVVIPDSVTSIGGSAFYYCRSLTSVVIGNSVNSIGYEAFCGCNSLKDVYYTDSSTKWASISIGSYNNSLTSATIHYNYVPTV